VLYPLSYEGIGCGVWTPARTSEHSPSGSSSALPYHERMPSGTILVVDDDPIIVSLLQVNFEIEGYDVLTATGGEAGLAQARSGSPDVVVLDVMMPGIDGLEVARRLRADPATRSIPVVMLSAKAQAADIQAGLEVADDYITKPFEPLELLERVGTLVARSRATQGRTD
jgi:DNA-binding response OmpR family regulator